MFDVKADVGRLGFPGLDTGGTVSDTQVVTLAVNPPVTVLTLQSASLKNTKHHFLNKLILDVRWSQNLLVFRDLAKSTLDGITKGDNFITVTTMMVAFFLQFLARMKCDLQ